MARSARKFAVAAALALCALGAAATASAEAGSTAHASSEAGISSLTKKQKQAKRKALKRCRSKRVVKVRKRCHRRVVRRFAKLARPIAPPAATVNVIDDFFVPDAVTVKRGESVLWVWDDLNHDPHNVTMTSGPPGVDRQDFETSLSPAVMFTFKRKFTVPGTYTFVCSLHFGMKLTVVVE